MTPVTLQGWLHGDAAAEILDGAGHPLDDLRVAARRPELIRDVLADAGTEKFGEDHFLRIFTGGKRTRLPNSGSIPSPYKKLVDSADTSWIGSRGW